MRWHTQQGAGLVRCPQSLLRRLSLPVLLEGLLPSKAQAQATKAKANEGATEAEPTALVYREWGRA